MRKILFVIAGVAVVGIILAVAVTKKDSPVGAQDDASPVLTVEEQKEVEQDKAAVVSAPAAARYVHPRLGFSFEKPQDYTVGALKGDDGSETLIVQPTVGDAKKGFQIFINPLAEPLELTPSVIKSELPGTSVNNAQAIVLDGKGKGMMFSSNNEAFGGKSFEIWFTDGGAGSHLYQITSYASFATQLQQIIGTWKF